MRSLSAVLASVALAGCGSSLVAEDVPRFDPRDAIVEEVFDAAAADLPGRFDVVPSVDVIPAGDLGVRSDAGAPGDVDGPCQAVSEDYAAAVREAQSCRVDRECGARVCETLCCACEVFVNAAGPEFARLELLRERWAMLGCATMGRCVGGVTCGAAVGVSCSTEGRCVTARERLSDAGASDAGAADVTWGTPPTDVGMDGASR